MAAHRAGRAAVALFFCLALTACAARGTGDVESAQPRTPQVTPAVAIPAPPAAPEPPPPPPRLIGLQHTEILGLLGQPAFQRQDAPALLLRYRAEDCILDLFLYPPLGQRVDGAPAVEHVEARTADGQQAATSECIAEVMKARAAAATG